jgi:hypothetical protein
VLQLIYCFTSPLLPRSHSAVKARKTAHGNQKFHGFAWATNTELTSPKWVNTRTLEQKKQKRKPGRIGARPGSATTNYCFVA